MYNISNELKNILLLYCIENTYLSYEHIILPETIDALDYYESIGKIKYSDNMELIKLWSSIPEYIRVGTAENILLLYYSDQILSICLKNDIISVFRHYKFNKEMAGKFILNLETGYMYLHEGYISKFPTYIPSLIFFRSVITDIQWGKFSKGEMNFCILSCCEEEIINV